MRDSIVKQLTEGKADVEAEDCQGRKPQAYQALTEELEAMKEPVAVDEQAPVEAQQPSAGEGTAPTEAEQAPAEGDQAPPAEGDQAPAAGETAAADGDAAVEQQLAAEAEQPPAEPAAE